PAQFYSLSLHDALPILRFGLGRTAASSAASCAVRWAAGLPKYASAAASTPNTPCPNSATFKYTSRMRRFGQAVSMSTVKYASRRSEEHTSELQSRENIV